jgi:putative transposase
VQVCCTEGWRDEISNAVSPSRINWQRGDGVFSVGISQARLHYFEQQFEHQRTQTFQEEYLAFLKKHDAHFDEKYLWD